MHIIQSELCICCGSKAEPIKGHRNKMLWLITLINWTAFIYNAPWRTCWPWARIEREKIDNHITYNAFFSFIFSTFYFSSCLVCIYTRATKRLSYGVNLFFLPFPEPKKQSISTLERECDTQSVELGTSPSCGGLRSVVRTKHQPGRSLGRSNSSTVWPGGRSAQLFYRVVTSDNLILQVLGDTFKVKLYWIFKENIFSCNFKY